MSHQRYFDAFLQAMNQIIYGKQEVIQEVLLTFLSGGHVLLKDKPGVGKTTLALAFAKGLGLDFKRIQFTPDVMPSDLTGFSIPDVQTKRFIYQPGVVFCNVLLADEINRTSPKTQSALLEVMEEGKVSVDGITRHVPQPFFVMATQNPDSAIGTQPLPEAQVDRFMIECSLDYPDRNAEIQLAQAMDSKKKIEHLSSLLNAQTIQYAKQEIEDVYVSDVIYRYIVDLVRKTRTEAMIQTGASPRATIALVKLAKATAWLKQRDYVIPQDVQKQFPFVVRHRIQLSTKAKAQHLEKEDFIENVLKSVKG